MKEIEEYVREVVGAGKAMRRFTDEGQLDANAAVLTPLRLC